MKKSFFSTSIWFLLCIGLVIYIIYKWLNPPPPCPPTASFPYLTYRLDSIRNKWLSGNYEDFVLNSYDSSSQQPWQLISYGQKDMNPVFTFTRVSDPFPVFRGIIDNMPIVQFDSTKIGIGNLMIADSTMSKIAIDTSKGANVLLFVPTIYTDSSLKHLTKHLTYRLRLGIMGTDNHITVVPFDSTLYSTKELILHPGDNTPAIDLNPCPPAHVDQY